MLMSNAREGEPSDDGERGSVASEWKKRQARILARLLRMHMTDLHTFGPPSVRRKTAVPPMNRF